MTEGNFRRQMLRFAIPAFISNLFQNLYNMADSLIVGKFAGKEALAAVSSSGNLIFLFNSFFIGMMMGAGTLVARFFGAKDEHNMSRAIHSTVALGLMSGLFLTAFGVAFTPTVLRWMKTDPKVLPLSISYFRFYFLGALAMIMYNVCTSIMNAVGNTTRPLVYLVISSCLNVVLDLLFVGVLHGSVREAAIATTISQLFSVCLCLTHLLRRDLSYGIRIREIRLHGDLFGEILRYGIPGGVQNSVIALANVFVQSNINDFGADAMAGCGAYMKTEGFAFLPINSFTLALSTFVSQNLGAGRTDRMRQGARFGTTVSVIMSAGIGLVFYLFAPKILTAYTDDPGVLAYGVQWARTTSPFYALLAFSHCSAAILRGASKTYVPMFVMLGVWCVLRVIYISVIMGITHDIANLFWAYPLTWTISSLIYAVNFLFFRWYPKPGKGDPGGSEA